MRETMLKPEDERMRALVVEIVKALVNEDEVVRAELLEESEATTG